jgi:hypothetical protein
LGNVSTNNKQKSRMKESDKKHLQTVINSKWMKRKLKLPKCSNYSKSHISWCCTKIFVFQKRLEHHGRWLIWEDIWILNENARSGKEAKCIFLQDCEQHEPYQIEVLSFVENLQELVPFVF